MVGLWVNAFQFKWLTEKEINKLNVQGQDSNKGFILEVDLQYPKKLHDLHTDYPRATEQVKVTEDMLSDYCKQIKDKYNISVGDVHKLTPALGNKIKHVLHCRNLQLYLSLGLKLTKIHLVLEFNQTPWFERIRPAQHEPNLTSNE